MFISLRTQAVKSVSRTTLGVHLLSSGAHRMHSTVRYSPRSDRWENGLIDSSQPIKKVEVRRLHTSSPRLLGPYLRPLSYEYESAARRLASRPILPNLRAHKARREASQSRQSVDTHDPHGLGREDYDILIPDIDVRKLKNGIADVAGIPYHSPATKEEADAVVKIGDCFLYGPNLRIFFPAIVSSPEGKAHWVFFLVNFSSSLTYLSTQTSDLFGITSRHADVSAAVAIAGYHHIVYRAPQHSHFAEVDILGTHFLNAHGVSLVTDFAALRAKLFFGGMAWKVMVQGAKL